MVLGGQKLTFIGFCLNITFTTQVTRTEYVDSEDGRRGYPLEGKEIHLFPAAKRPDARPKAALFANIQAKNVYSNSISIKRAYKVTFIKGYKSTKDWLLKTIIKGFFRVTSPP